MSEAFADMSASLYITLVEKDPEKFITFRNHEGQIPNSYRGKAATTEDFKATVEKRTTHKMDLEGNPKLAWFFNECACTKCRSLPTNLTPRSKPTPDGTVVQNLSVAQSGVDNKFRTLILFTLNWTTTRLRSLKERAWATLVAASTSSK